LGVKFITKTLLQELRHRETNTIADLLISRATDNCVDGILKSK